jgi:hypothetical protein
VQQFCNPTPIHGSCRNQDISTKKPERQRELANAARKEAFTLFQFQKQPFEESLMDKNYMSALRNKHEALDRKINEEETRPLPDTIRIHSLKKEKLRLKEVLQD